MLTATATHALPPLPSTKPFAGLVRIWRGEECLERLQRANASALLSSQANSAYDARWLQVLHDGLGHVPWCIEYTENNELLGWLPLSEVSSALFGRYLVSLPYLNTGGVLAGTPEIATALIDAAIELANERNTKHLQLRHEAHIAHPSLAGEITSKVHMRLPLPATADALWKQLSSKVRNQVRKGEKQSFTVTWGTKELLNGFYDVFSRNMRDLGTPVYSRRLFASMLEQFPSDAEICLIQQGSTSVAAGMVVHGHGMSQVLSASSLRDYNALCPNMLLYWQLLLHTIERGQAVFDFGRSTIDSNTYRFKQQWGAQPHPAIWQFYLRQGQAQDLRPESARFQLATKIWQKLPLGLSRFFGPAIIRGIP